MKAETTENAVRGRSRFLCILCGEYADTYMHPSQSGERMQPRDCPELVEGEQVLGKLKMEKPQRGERHLPRTTSK
jgi:hypothetical protein